VDDIRSVAIGVDGSPAGLVALRQALRVRAPGAPVLAVTVCNTAVAVHAGFDAPRVAGQIQADAETARGEADEAMVGHEQTASRVIEGRPGPVLGELVRHNEVTLLVGAHRGSRAGGILLGSVATELLHQLSCAILLAGEPADPDRFPRRIVLALDGSTHSAGAAANADELARRLGIEILPIASEGGKAIDRVAVRAIAEGLQGRDGAGPLRSPTAGRGDRRGRGVRGPEGHGRQRASRSAGPGQRERARRPPGGLLGAGHPPVLDHVAGAWNLPGARGGGCS